MSELEELAKQLAEHRKNVKEGEKFIKTNQPRYFSLLDETVGKGKVTFVGGDYVFGRVAVEYYELDLPMLMLKRPDIAQKVVDMVPKLNEDKLDEYLTAHPKEREVIEGFMVKKEQERWMPPKRREQEDA